MYDVMPAFWPMVAALLVGLFGGVVKGLVGFALPVILVSGVGTFVAPELAVASIVVPAILTNLWQGFRQGASTAVQTLQTHRLLIGIGLVTVVVSAQLVPILPGRALLAALGAIIALVCAVQLLGWRPALRADDRRAAVSTGLIAGLFGGLGGIFGPPFVLYLTAINTPKAEQTRVLGVVFSLQLIVFTGAHVVSGIVRWETLAFSALIAIPVLVGTRIGFQLQDQVDQAMFRKLTLIVLLLAGLNLLRRALLG